MFSRYIGSASQNLTFYFYQKIVVDIAPKTVASKNRAKEKNPAEMAPIP
tara:strand:- start:750 stop:896 length:147 start_codon:yes stop_codon:yes gene_type:complete